VLRLTGAATKELATFIVAALKNPQKQKDKKAARYGPVRLETMLQCEKPIEIFSIREENLKAFVTGSKQYGILYCALKNPKDCPDNLCDIMVKADDAPKIRRIAERYGFTTLPKTTVEHERERAAQSEPEPNAPNRETADDLVDDLLSKEEGREQTYPNPDMAKTESPHPSAPFSETRPSSARGISDDRCVAEPNERASVRGELREIKESRKAKTSDAPARDERKAEPSHTTTHKPPIKGRKYKLKKGSAR